MWEPLKSLTRCSQTTSLNDSEEWSREFAPKLLQLLRMPLSLEADAIKKYLQAMCRFHERREQLEYPFIEKCLTNLAA